MNSFASSKGQILAMMAIAEDGAYGLSGSPNGLPWHLPEDLKHFQEKTLGKAIIMGRATYEQLGRPLKDRLNIVVSSSELVLPAPWLSVSSLEKGCDEARASSGFEANQEIILIGGATLLRSAWGAIEGFWLTRVHGEFPKATARAMDILEKLQQPVFTCLQSSEHISQTGIGYRIEYWQRNC